MAYPISRRGLLTGVGASTIGLVAGQTFGRERPARNVSDKMVRIIANENPYGPSPQALIAYTAAGGESWQYATRRETKLKQLIAKREGLSEKQVMIAAGSTEVLRAAALAFGRDGGEVVCAKPSFSFLRNYALKLGCSATEVPLDSAMRHDLDAMSRAVSSATKLIYLCNPNNPTGTLVDGAKIRAFIKTAAPRAPVLVDEAYLDIWDKELEHSAAANVRAGDPVIVTRTFSKLHGLAGLRIGYAIGHADLISRLEALRMSILNLPGIQAATASYLDHEFQDFSRKKIKKAVQITENALDELNRPYARTRANFILFDTGDSAAKFMRAMRQRGFLTGLSFPPYKNWSRISMGTTEQMASFASALHSYFGR